jgi:hypothetical protein
MAAAARRGWEVSIGQWRWEVRGRLPGTPPHGPRLLLLRTLVVMLLLLLLLLQV